MNDASRMIRPSLVRAPSGPLAAVSGAIADRLLRRAAGKLPLRLAYPGGSVIGAGDPVSTVWV